MNLDKKLIAIPPIALAASLASQHVAAIRLSRARLGNSVGPANNLPPRHRQLLPAAPTICEWFNSGGGTQFQGYQH